ncbi:MAG: peptidylprolyl isomerase [Pyrinomonadaceae bacterium]|nr:peptidylprolyl isomerase [Pyrinomonadaceae bacterium]MCX7639976.1 peptidylprolyl isomerase [Pyrinomonadaceae bacterium]MDW8304148.1 peptidylprolyl isomerase [Acidobacteriota bacterium]
MKSFILILLPLCILKISAQEKIPIQVALEIVKAEDQRKFDQKIESLLRSQNSEIRKRAALAAGRIGDERAVTVLSEIALNDKNEPVRLNAIFALGEIESIKGAEAVLKILEDEKQPEASRAVAIEAAGKIASANPKFELAKALSEAIVETLELESTKTTQNRELILLGLTATFRAPTTNSEKAVSLFLTHTDPHIRASAANAIARLRSRNFNEALRIMLLTDPDPIARANAARALGVAEDKASAGILLEAALSDDDKRVQISSIRALGFIKEKSSSEKLIEKAEKLLELAKKSEFKNPPEKNELLEITTTIGLLLANSNDEKAVSFIKNFRKNTRLEPEIEIALARIAPENYIKLLNQEIRNLKTWRDYAATAQALETFAGLPENLRAQAIQLLQLIMKKAPVMSQPSILSAMVSLEAEKAEEIVRKALESDDVFVRAKAAELITKFAPNEANTKTLALAFRKSLMKDVEYDDAQLAILSAITKLDKEKARLLLKEAFSSPNYLVRKQAFILMNEIDKQQQEKFDHLVGIVNPYKPSHKTKLGQTTSTTADYLRAISRRNRIKAKVITEKGDFTIELKPEEAPLTVDNFIKLARRGFYNGLEIHRVVPNFVIQDGDPRGDSNGGPGWQIRCEINMLKYLRGAVGMALSGKDTGGSQWFITHSPQPHLDGGYTVFGYVNEKDMKVVDSIVRGDKILKIEIIEISSKKAKLRR